MIETVHDEHYIQLFIRKLTMLKNINMRGLVDILMVHHIYS